MRNSSGKIGEQYIQQLLQKQGYILRAANYRSRYGEIDIIAEKEQYIVFVEVKTRDEKRKAEPLEAVTAIKRKKVVQTAMLYLQEHMQAQKLQPRFDVAGVITSGREQTVIQVQYLEGAFDAGGLF